jgi:tetratricopeptide (TPR) repeat protein
MSRNAIQAVLAAVALAFVGHGAAGAEDLSLCMQGWNASQSGQYARAIGLYDECIRTGALSRPMLARTHRNYGIAYRMQGEPQKAIDHFDKALALQPQDAWADWINRANALSDAKRYEEALADLDKAAALQPGSADLHYNRGIVYERLNELEKAKAEFREAYRKGLRSQQLYERFVVHRMLDEQAPAR